MGVVIIEGPAIGSGIAILSQPKVVRAAWKISGGKRVPGLKYCSKRLNVRIVDGSGATFKFTSVQFVAVPNNKTFPMDVMYTRRITRTIPAVTAFKQLYATSSEIRH